MTIKNDDMMAIGDALMRKGWKLATAESCTGGLLAHGITSLPGCSRWYCGGVVAYADTTKTALLGVPARLILRDGAVSESVAAAMAQGAFEKMPEANIAVSITGIAGPDGGCPDKPVGLVYVGLARAGEKARTHKLQLEGTRSEIQIAAGNAALEMLYHALSENESS